MIAFTDTTGGCHPKLIIHLELDRYDMQDAGFEYFRHLEGFFAGASNSLWKLIWKLLVFRFRMLIRGK